VFLKSKRAAPMATQQERLFGRGWCSKPAAAAANQTGGWMSFIKRMYQSLEFDD
jgi:hypothetical protein